MAWPPSIFLWFCPESDVMKLILSQCPVYDLDNNVAFTGMYQTMTKKGAVTVQVMFEWCLWDACVRQSGHSSPHTGRLTFD